METASSKENLPSSYELTLKNIQIEILYGIRKYSEVIDDRSWMDGKKNEDVINSFSQFIYNELLSLLDEQDLSTNGVFFVAFASNADDFKTSWIGYSYYYDSNLKRHLHCFSMSARYLADRLVEFQQNREKTKARVYGDLCHEVYHYKTSRDYPSTIDRSVSATKNIDKDITKYHLNLSERASNLFSINQLRKRGLFGPGSLPFRLNCLLLSVKNAKEYTRRMDWARGIRKVEVENQNLKAEIEHLKRNRLS